MIIFIFYSIDTSSRSAYAKSPSYRRSIRDTATYTLVAISIVALVHSPQGAILQTYANHLITNAT
jgi:cation transporter-like permease